jgi:hypothetical protein
MLFSNEHKEYLKKIKIEKMIILSSQILIFTLFLFLCKIFYLIF